MKHMKFLAFVLLVLISSLGMVQAANTDVGVIIYPPTGGPESVCLTFDSSDTLYEALEDSLNAIEDNYDLQDEDLSLVAGYDSAIAEIISLTKDTVTQNNDETDIENRQVWSVFTNHANATSFSVLNSSINEYSFTNSPSINNGYVFAIKYSNFNDTNLTSAMPTYVPFTTVCKNMLDLTEIEIDVGSKSSSADEDGGDIKKVYPESNIKFKITLENLYSDDSEMLIEDIEIIATWESIDDGDDIEIEASIDELKAEKDKSVYIEFETPLIVEEKDFDLILEITAQDLNGREFEYEIDYVTEIAKESHDVRITKFEVSPLEFSCEKLLSFNYELLNLGDEDDNEEVVISISNPGLGLSYTATKVLEGDIDDDTNRLSDSFSIVIPEDRPDGAYQLELKATYYSQSTSRRIDLLASECVKEVPTVPVVDDTTTTVPTETTPTTPEETIPSTTEPTETEDLEEDDEGMPTWAIVLIIVGGVILYMSVLAAVIITVKNKNKPPVARQKPMQQQRRPPVQRAPPQQPQEPNFGSDEDSFY